MAEITRGLEKFLQELAGSAAAGIIKALRDDLHPHRAARQLMLLDRVARMLRENGWGVTAVPASLLLSALDQVSVEDNEPRHRAWAALLANAAGNADRLTLTPAFAEILGQLAPNETTFLISLNEFVERAFGNGKDELECPAAQGIVLGTDVDLLIKYLKLGLGRPKETREQALKNIPGDLRDFMVILDNLEQLSLLAHYLDMEAPGWGMPSDVPGIDPVRIYQLTLLGYQFIRACRPPISPDVRRKRHWPGKDPGFGKES